MEMNSNEKNEAAFLTDIPFNTACEKWLSEVKEQSKQSTYIKYRNIISRYFDPLFEEDSSKDIWSVPLRTIIENVWNDENNMPSESTVRSIKSVYSSLAKYCHIDIAPHLLIWHRYTGVVEEHRKLITTFTARQQRKLVSFLLEESDSFRTGILICLYTGMRIGEICALRTADISLKEKKIYISRTVQRLSINSEENINRTALVESPPKTSSSYREIPICSFLFSVLSRRMPGGLYFLGDDSPIDPRRFQYRFKRYQERIGIEVLNFHALRHTFATNCISGGMDPKTLSVILGHADVKTTLNRYVHPSSDLKLKQLNKCVKHFPVAALKGL